MLQNREVGGATMGAGRGAIVEESTRGTVRPRGRVPEFGPVGYLNLAVPVVLVVLVIAAGEAGWLVARNGGLTLAILAVVAATSALAAWTRRLGSEVDARFRAAPRTPAVRVQRWATIGIAALLVCALGFSVAGLHVVVVPLLGVLVGALAGVAPTFFQTPPAAPREPIGS